jgi:hypothetical protein
MSNEKETFGLWEKTECNKCGKILWYERVFENENEIICDDCREYERIFKEAYNEGYEARKAEEAVVLREADLRGYRDGWKHSKRVAVKAALKRFLKWA